jgi:hypothetical protein
MSGNITYATVLAGSGTVLLDRVVGSDGNNYTQAALTSITCAVTDITTGTPVAVITPTVTIASVVYDTLQTGNLWRNRDATGYNFAHAMPITAFPTASHVYKVIYMFTPVSGTVCLTEFIITAE